MKKIFVLCTIIIQSLISIPPVLSQNLTVGILNGINFTRPHGDFTSGRWVTKNGPVAGLFFNYQITKIISLQTEFNFTVVNYSHKNYANALYVDHPVLFSSSSLYPSYYNNVSERWEFSFYRIPLYLKLSTPTKLKLEMAMGGYLGFRSNFETPYYPVYLAYNDIMASSNNYDDPPKHDAGYFYSVGLSYPIAAHFNIYLNGRYFSGRRTYIESVSAKNGIAEMTFGLGYSGFLKNRNTAEKHEYTGDSASHSLSVKVKSGIAFSGNSGSDNNDMYSKSTGFSSGLSFMYRLSKHFALQSEVLYERKGYQLSGESNAFYKFTPGSFYTIDNKVSLDYVTIPLLLNLRFGEKFTVYFNAGLYAAMRMNARCTGTAYNTIISETSYQVNKITVNDDIDGFIKSNDWGWALGGGIQYPVLKKYKLDFEFRYNTGNPNIYSDRVYRSPVVNEDTRIKNKSYVIAAGFQIPLN